MCSSSNHFGDVSARVLAQHAEIRTYLRELDALDGSLSSPLAAAHLRVSLLRLALLFESHLVFEELELAPWIRDVDAWGPCREAAMLDEHDHQRVRLRTICAMAEAAAIDELELSQEVSNLLVSLLEDMAREERQLSLLGWLYDYGAEQMTG
jgi:hypothetical protein